MSLFDTAFTQPNNIARIQALRPDLASLNSSQILDWYNKFGRTELEAGSHAALTGVDTAHIASCGQTCKCSA
jgi:hypothetical protein